MNPLRELTVDQLRRRTSVKWSLYPEDVLPLWVAEMDVPLAEPVRRALVAAADGGDTGYASPDVYAEATREFSRARWGWDLAPDLTRLVPDVMLGIVEVLHLVTEHGDPVVINSPVYPPFYAFIEHAGRRVVESPLGEDGRLDLVGLERTFARVAHEIHAPLVLPGATHHPYLSLPGTDDAFSLLSASKAWNLTGVKAALAVAGPAAAPDLQRMPEIVGHGATHLGVLAHVAAFRDGVPWLEGLLAGLDENRRLLADLVEEQLPGVGYRVPDGTYLAWLDCRAGSDFGTGGEGYVRLNFATSPEVLAEAARRMASIIVGS